MMLCLSWLSRAQPNWAAPAYVSAIVLVVAWALARGWRRWVGAAVAINIALAVAAFGATDALAGAGMRSRPDTIRCTGCAAGRNWATRCRGCWRRTPD